MLIRDPIHGDIQLSALETTVLDTEPVQRLRGIKQLGTANLVYPGALHTRFDHSIGTCATAHILTAALRQNGNTISDEITALIGVAALLHDVTHVPFGHTLEDERRLFGRHDNGTRLNYLMDGELGDTLKHLDIFEPICGLLGLQHNPLPDWAAAVVSSTIDADLLDYLRRDSYFSGLAHNYDDRVFHYFALLDNQYLGLRMNKHGLQRQDARSEIIQVLRMRYFLTERVYFHHSKISAGAMISKAVEMAVRHALLQETDLLQLSDQSLLEKLATCDIDAIATLACNVLRRQLFKRAYVISAHTVPLPQRRTLVERYHKNADARAEAEQQIAARVGIAADNIIVYCPALSVMKEAAAWIETPSAILRLNDTTLQGHDEIKAIENGYAQLWRMYVFTPEKIATAAAQAATEVFDFASEYQRPSA